MEGVQHKASTFGTVRDEPPRDVAISGLADRQHGVVSLTQLKRLGLSASGVRSRVAAGRLHRKHRGVYAVGHPRLTRSGRWMAAVLACGPNAALSHRSAAGLWGLGPDNRARTDVSVPRPSARGRPGVEIHRSATLTPADITIQDGIPCTTVARTLLDLSEVVPHREVERAISQAEVARLFDLRAVEDVLGRANGHRGTGVLRTVLAAYHEPALTASDTEERFLALCRAASLPQPEVNVWLTLDDGTPAKIDFLWRREGLAIETDAFGTHGSRRAFESDRFRDQRLRLTGYDSIRFTRRQIVYEPAWVQATVATLYARLARAAR